MAVFIFPMPDESEAKVIFIAGPTASGKSAAALSLVRRIDAEIVNADAIQVYRDLAVLSARPSTQDMKSAPHHLFGHVDSADRYSAGRWARDAAGEIKKILAKGRRAIVVGGTGLYFRALEEGLSPIPDVPDEIRELARSRLNEIGAAAFRDEVIRRDPAMARLTANDAQRLIRAWEVHEATGERLSDLQNAPRQPLIDSPAARILVEPPRDVLYGNCERRFDEMMRHGALEEARALAERGLDPSLPVMKALGAAELMAHLGGAMTLEDAIALAKQNTRRFAKRQLTWFRNQAADWPRAANASDAVSSGLAILKIDDSDL